MIARIFHSTSDREGLVRRQRSRYPRVSGVSGDTFPTPPPKLRKCLDLWQVIISLAYSLNARNTEIRPFTHKIKNNLWLCTHGNAHDREKLSASISWSVPMQSVNDVYVLPCLISADSARINIIAQALNHEILCLKYSKSDVIHQISLGFKF